MSIKYPFLPLRDINRPYNAEIAAALNDILESGWYLHGKYTESLEQSLASLCSTQHAVACSNGLDALRLIIRAYKELGVMADGDEVVVQANTYIASVLAISDNNLRPVLVDTDPATLNMDFSLLEQRISPRTRAVMVVHLYGAPCWSERLVDIARRHNLKIIEDNAQAIGATSAAAGLWGTHMTGGLGDAAAFSFYPTKNIGALGDAGAVTTNDSALADAVKALANYGSDRRYHNIFRGLNCRMDEMQAAALCVKLRHLDEVTARRRANARAYDRAIDNPLVAKPQMLEGNVWHQYEVLVSGGRRDDFRNYLADNGVQTDVHYAVPPHCQPCYPHLADIPLPATERLAGEYVSLPIAEHLCEDDILGISNIINNYR